MNDKIKTDFEAWFEADCMPAESDWFRKDSDGDYDYNPAYWSHRGYKACAESMQADKDKLEVMLEASRLAADSILKDWHKSQVANDKLEARVKELEGNQQRWRIKIDRSYGRLIEGHWFYLLPADEFADKALTDHINNLIGQNKMNKPQLRKALQPLVKEN